MRTESRSRTAGARRQDTAFGTAIEFAEPGLVAFGSMALAMVFFPLLVLGSAAVLLSLSWPLFLGAYLEYGYVPGSPVRSARTVSGVWYALTFAWLGLLIVGPVAFRRFRSTIGLLRVDPERPHEPRPRV